MMLLVSTVSLNFLANAKNASIFPSFVKAKNILLSAPLLCDGNQLEFIINELASLKPSISDPLNRSIFASLNSCSTLFSWWLTAVTINSFIFLRVLIPDRFRWFYFDFKPATPHYRPKTFYFGELIFIFLLLLFLYSFSSLSYSTLVVPPTA